MKNNLPLKLDFFIVIFLCAFSLSAQQNSFSPIEYSKKVADKIIRETSFEFSFENQKPSGTVQSIDFGFEFAESGGGAVYAASYILAAEDVKALLGISHNLPLKIWINGKEIYSRETGNGSYKEVAYDIYSFPDELGIILKKGENRILLKSISGIQDGSAKLALLEENHLIKQKTEFSLKPLSANFETEKKWIFAGAFKSADTPLENFNTVYEPEKSFQNYYNSAENGFVTWKLSGSRLVLKDVIKPEYSFRQHSYFEWNYANGQTMLAVSQLADATGVNKYSEHVKKYCGTTLGTYDYFKHQFYAMNEKTGFNYRIFRKAMLDDSSAPVLPYVELYNKGILPESKFLIDEMADYIFNKQERLEDRTLCRPEPEPNTVWADDLFMSVTFLLRYSEMTGDTKYAADASRQVVNFLKYLYDEKLGVCYHGWFNDRQKNSPVHWGRANGWLAWSISEALLRLPESDQNYPGILAGYKKFMNGLKKLQDQSGMWHQVLDHPESYEETSCTAMFTIAMARGVKNGWLDNSFKNNVINGWKAVASKIDQDGTVSGICRGTGIGEDNDFYFKRATFKNDPRGLGSVIVAGIEVQSLLDMK